MVNVILSGAMVAVFLLFYGAIRLWMRAGFGQKPLMMIGAALVILANVVIWAVPDNQGRSLLKEAARDDGESALK